MPWLMLMLLLPTSAGAVDQTVPASTAVTPPRVIPESFLMDQGYPSAALRLRQEGRSVARLHVDAKGRVAGCTIEQSSGSASLDEATCSFLQARHFHAARDAAGRAVEGDVALPMIWRLPH